MSNKNREAYKIFPSLKLLLKEFRTIREFIGFLRARRSLPDIDHGYPVMVLPGILHGDGYTAPIRKLLNEKGVSCYGWRQGINKGYFQRIENNLMELIEEILQETNSSKITLIGWSLGGVYARELAWKMPDKIFKVITLASPYRLDSSPVPELIYRCLAKRKIVELNSISSSHTDIPVPVIQIYSSMDGILFWKSCLGNGNNREVQGSHLGMPHNPEVIEEIFQILNS